MAYVIALGACVAGAWAAAPAKTAVDVSKIPPAAARPIDFVKDVQPILAKSCYSCHGAKKEKGNYRLDMRDAAFKGGDEGVAIIPGKGIDSPLIHLVAGLDEDRLMPAKGERLTPEQVGLLRAWIDQGAKWPVEADAVQSQDKADHWAYKPVARVVPPAVKTPGWVRNPIDAFVLAKLESKGLSPSPAADRRALLRRITFDLTGLPPTPAETAAFLADASPDAYEKLVDRLLASPAYGERWGRHWLDVAHYADTHGFERDQKRPNAWRYRDWVIDAFNRDLPYDQFLRDQIAGDVIAPNDPQKVIATGFLAAGPWDFVGHEETKSPILRRKARADDLDDMVTTTIAGSMALTINCARCHDHKFDPLPQADYYSLAAIFAGVRRGDRPANPSDESRRGTLTTQIAALDAALAPAAGDRVDLAASVGEAVAGGGVDPRNGSATRDRTQFLTDVAVNAFRPSKVKFVDGVFIPDGGAPGGEKVQASSTGVVVSGLPKTSAQSWDYVSNGPFSLLKSTKLGPVDYAAAGHTLLGLHANKGITFDLAAVRAASPGRKVLRFEAAAGNGDVGAADFWVYVDGNLKAKQVRVKDANGPFPLDIPLADADRFLTLVATDGGDGISNDQIFFGDARLVLSPTSAGGAPSISPADRAKQVAQRDALKKELDSLGKEKVYALVSGAAEPMRLMRRGDPESPGDPVKPGALTAIPGLSALAADDAMPEGKRRLALADWIVSPANPLPARVIVNRLWHYHFGRGIVGTPSDFGKNGELPSHPELLDWLAARLPAEGWSLKRMHRLIVTSNTYRQTSQPGADVVARAGAIDADNRMLWRMNGRRLEAEAIRDSVLSVSGKLNPQAGGPGFEPFKFIDKYAPIYEYITPDRPELWRRSIYAFVVRSVPDAFMEVLDCPNPSNFTPARTPTTTALQALAMSNNPFVLQQATFFAARLETTSKEIDAQVRSAYDLAFARAPADDERAAAKALIAKHGLPSFCRALLNANEFFYVD